MILTSYSATPSACGVAVSLYYVGLPLSYANATQSGPDFFVTVASPQVVLNEAPMSKILLSVDGAPASYITITLVSPASARST